MFHCDLFESGGEPGEDLLHVAALLHRDDAAVVFLVNPDQEALLVVVPA